MSHVMEQKTASEHIFDYYQQIAELFEELQELNGLARLSLNFGNLLVNREDLTGGLTAYERGYKAALKIGDDQLCATCMMSIGQVYEQKNEPECAIYYYKKALTHLQQIFDNDQISQCIQHMEKCATKLQWNPIENPNPPGL